MVDTGWRGRWQGCLSAWDKQLVTHSPLSCGHQFLVLEVLGGRKWGEALSGAGESRTWLLVANRPAPSDLQVPLGESGWWSSRGTRLPTPNKETGSAATWQWQGFRRVSLTRQQVVLTTFVPLSLCFPTQA